MKQKDTLVKVLMEEGFTDIVIDDELSTRSSYPIASYDNGYWHNDELGTSCESSYWNIECKKNGHPRELRLYPHLCSSERIELYYSLSYNEYKRVGELSPYSPEALDDETKDLYFNGTKLIKITLSDLEEEPKRSYIVVTVHVTDEEKWISVSAKLIEHSSPKDAVYEVIRELVGEEDADKDANWIGYFLDVILEPKGIWLFVFTPEGWFMEDASTKDKMWTGG